MWLALLLSAANCTEHWKFQNLHLFSVRYDFSMYMHTGRQTGELGHLLGRPFPINIWPLNT